MPPRIKTSWERAWNSASTPSIRCLLSMEVRSSDSSTGSRSCASSRVNVREDMSMGIFYSVVGRWSLVVGKTVVSQPCIVQGNTVLPTTKDQRPTAALLNFQHPIQGHARPVLHVVADLDSIHDVAVHKAFQRPAEVLRRDAEHGRAQAARVVEGNDFLPFRGELLAHAVHEMDLSADGEHAPRRRLANHLEQTFRRADAVRFLAHFPAALRMNNYANARIFGANVVHMLRQEPLMDRTVALPQNHAGLLQTLGIDAA